MKRHGFWVVLICNLCALILFAISNPLEAHESILSETQTVLRQDAEDKAALPESFRRVEWLRASGSAQFSEKELLEVKKNISEVKIVLVDLRQESHGFINGLPISWYGEKNWANAGKSVEEVLQLEQKELSELAAAQQAIVYSKLKKDKSSGGLVSAVSMAVPIEVVSSEEQLARQNEMGYFRLAITDHCRPDDESVERFVEFVRTLPPGSWLHMHCEAGHGRTTTFLTMYDMMKNAKNDSCAAIITRQRDIGGIDLLSSEEDRGWRMEKDQERKRFIKRFYQYCQANDDQYSLKWTIWNQMHPIPIDE